MTSETLRETVLINRYSSRRLYNTETSDYVTLDDIGAMIRDGKDIQILDKKTGDDLTRQYLLQIITDHESRGENVLPLNVLTDIVRSYSDKAQSFIPDFLAQSFEMVKDQHEELFGSLQRQVSDTLDPQKAMDKIGEWQQSQAELLGSIMQPWTGAGDDDDTPEPETGQGDDAEPAAKPAAKSADQAGELDALKRQLADMQEKLNKLS